MKGRRLNLQTVGLGWVKNTLIACDIDGSLKHETDASEEA
jgi:hypothetical protein